MTRVPYDQAAKALLEEALRTLGKTSVQHEIASEPQWVDVWFEPDGEASGRGLLGRMARTDALFEAHRDPPGPSELYACLRKQLALARGRPIPTLWIVSAGRPDAALTGLAMTPRPGWPSGVYAMASEEWLPCFVVVVSELPETRETLLVRLMGAGATLKRAVREARQLEEDAWERRPAVAAITVLRSRLDTLEPSDQELAMEINETYDQWEARVTREAQDRAEHRGRAKGLEQGREQGLEQGREQGLEQGRADVVLRLLSRRFGVLGSTDEARVRAASGQQLDTLLDRLLTAATLDDVLR